MPDLKWQQGVPEQDGWYWYIHEQDRGWVDPMPVRVTGMWIVPPAEHCAGWAAQASSWFYGPLEPPEAPSVTGAGTGASAGQAPEKGTEGV